MKAGKRFVPGELIETSRQLGFEPNAAERLAQDMKQTVRELEDSPSATPIFTSVKLGRIGLFGSSGELKTDDKLWIRYSENNEGHSNAALDIMEDGRHRSFTLSHRTKTWEERRDKDIDPIGELTGEELVSFLQPKIRKPEALAPLLDATSFDPMDIPRLLASHLTRSAHRREKGLVYGTENARLTELAIGGSYIHTLQTSAPYEIGKTTIHKSYSFATETSDAFFYNASGSVTVSSKDGYTQGELEPYAASDENVNNQLFSLYRALALIREHHGLVDDTAA